MKREFTATAYVVHERQFLFVYHHKYAKWMPPGGHLEHNETPCEAVVREVYEETGIQIELIPHKGFAYPNACSLPLPYHVLLEEIPERGSFPAHQHIDFIYLARPLSDPTPTEGARWFTPQELQDMRVPEELFPEVRDMIRMIIARGGDDQDTNDLKDSKSDESKIWF